MREQLDKDNISCKDSGKRRMQGTRDEVGTKACMVGKIVKSRTK